MELLGVDISFCGVTLIIVAVTIGAVPLIRSWLAGRTCPSTARLDGKTVIITGANTGIGKEAALELARRGAHIILACRNAEKGENAAKEVRLTTGNNNIKFAKLNLASFKSIRDFAEKILESETKINILINNAGLAATPYEETEDGYEMQFGVNHLGHFLLTLLLLERIVQSSPARIINVSSIAYRRGKIQFDDINSKKEYRPLLAYCQSKLANILFTRELAKHLQGTGVTTYCLHPGAVQTELLRYVGDSVGMIYTWLFAIFMSLFSKTAKQGAQTTIYCAVAELGNESGYFYSECQRSKLLKHATDDAIATKLWEVSERFTGIKIKDLKLQA